MTFDFNTSIEEFDNGHAEIKTVNGQPLHVGVLVNGLHRQHYSKHDLYGLILKQLDHPEFKVKRAYEIMTYYLRQGNVTYVKDAFCTRFNGLTDMAGHRYLTPEFFNADDVESIYKIVEEMKHYFISKYTMMIMSDIKLTKLQQAIHNFIVKSDYDTYFEKDIRMLVCLPHVYETDLELDRVSQLTDTETPVPDLNYFDFRQDCYGELIGCCNPVSRMNNYNLFFKGLETNRLISVMLSVNPANRYLLECLMRSKTPQVMFEGDGQYVTYGVDTVMVSLQHGNIKPMP